MKNPITIYGNILVQNLQKYIDEIKKNKYYLEYKTKFEKYISYKKYGKAFGEYKKMDNLIRKKILCGLTENLNSFKNILATNADIYWADNNNTVYLILNVAILNRKIFIPKNNNIEQSFVNYIQGKSFKFPDDVKNFLTNIIKNKNNNWSSINSSSSKLYYSTYTPGSISISTGYTITGSYTCNYESYDNNGYMGLVFTPGSSGNTAEFTVTNPNFGPINLTIISVGGGGSAGQYGAGGGGGGITYLNSANLPNNSNFNLTIGTGGTWDYTTGKGSNGQNSVITLYVPDYDPDYELISYGGSCNNDNPNGGTGGSINNLYDSSFSTFSPGAGGGGGGAGGYYDPANNFIGSGIGGLGGCDISGNFCGQNGYNTNNNYVPGNGGSSFYNYKNIPITVPFYTSPSTTLNLGGAGGGGGQYNSNGSTTYYYGYPGNGFGGQVISSINSESVTTSSISGTTNNYGNGGGAGATYDTSNSNTWGNGGFGTIIIYYNINST